MAKQSGPRVRVKTTDMSWIVAILTAVSLSACAASPWRQAGHSAKDVSKDLAACEKIAERETLTAMGQSRAAYGRETAPGVGGGNRNQDPMALHDRNQTNDKYRGAIGRCMSGMGYSSGHAADAASRK
jgi:hypothetical protein